MVCRSHKLFDYQSQRGIAKVVWRKEFVGGNALGVSELAEENKDLRHGFGSNAMLLADQWTL